MMILPTLSLLRTEKRAEISKLAILVVPFVSILVSILVAVLVVWPKFNGALKLKADNKDLAILAQKLEAKAQKLSSFKRSQLEEELSAAEQLLPSDKGVFVVVAQIENAAARSGILLNRLDVAPGAVGPPTTLKGRAAEGGVPEAPQPGGEPTEAAKIQLKISLVGDYRSLLQFLTNTLVIPRVISIRDLTIASSGQSSEVNSSFTIDAYWQPIPSELASIETPVEDLTEAEIARLSKVVLVPEATSAAVPPVPLGRSDLFAPF